jgi:hypothetical protein
VAIVVANRPEITGGLTGEQYLRLPHAVVHTLRQSSLVEESAQKRFGVQLDVRAVTESMLEISYLVTRTSLIGVVPQPLARLLKDFPGIRIFGAARRGHAWKPPGQVLAPLLAARSLACLDARHHPQGDLPSLVSLEEVRRLLYRALRTQIVSPRSS